MKASGISFHHPWAFWLGCLLITAGAVIAARDMIFRRKVAA